MSSADLLFSQIHAHPQSRVLSPIFRMADLVMTKDPLPPVLQAEHVQAPVLTGAASCPDLSDGLKEVEDSVL